MSKKFEKMRKNEEIFNSKYEETSIAGEGKIYCDPKKEKR